MNKLSLSLKLFFFSSKGSLPSSFPSVIKISIIPSFTSCSGIKACAKKYSLFLKKSWTFFAISCISENVNSLLICSFSISNISSSLIPFFFPTNLKPLTSNLSPFWTGSPFIKLLSSGIIFGNSLNLLSSFSKFNSVPE